MQTVKMGIDPDTDKSGVAILSSEGLILKNLRFFELFEEIRDISYLCILNQQKFEVTIEAGWLNKSNWHTSSKNSMHVNTKIGNATGANHEVGSKIVVMCEYLNVTYNIITPKRSKTDSATFKQITNYDKRTNQEQRDAAMLLYRNNV